MPAVTTRPVDSADTPFLMDVFAHGGDVPAWLYATDPNLLQFQFTAQRAAYDAHFPGAAHEIILVDGEPAGQAWWTEVADEIRILDIALLPRFRRLGAGTTVYRRLLARARETNKPVRASVGRLNRPSLAFHLRLGFTVTGESESHLFLTAAANPPQD